MIVLTVIVLTCGQLKFDRAANNNMKDQVTNEEQIDGTQLEQNPFQQWIVTHFSFLFGFIFYICLHCYGKDPLFFLLCILMLLFGFDHAQNRSLQCMIRSTTMNQFENYYSIEDGCTILKMQTITR